MYIKKAQSLMFILALLLNSSCLTQQLWESKKYYDETIKEYLISADGSKVVFLGKKYHYIFDDNSGMVKQLLQWGGRQKLIMNLYDFEVTSKNEVKITASVTTASQEESSNKNLSALSVDEINFLKKLGFSKIEGVGNNILYKTIDLKGVRYLPKPGVSYEVSLSLNKEYKVKVEYSNFFDKATKVALTPLSVTGDAFLIVSITGVTIVCVTVAGAISFPLYFIACEQNPKKCNKY